MIIDAHIHLGSCSVVYPYAETKLDRIIKMLHAEGVDYALASSAKALFYDCTEGNQEVLAAVKKYPEIFPCLVVNPWLTKEALEALEHCREQGFIGVKLHPNCHSYALNSRVAEPVLAFCQEKKIPVLTHSTGGHAFSGAEAIEGAVKKFPDLTLVIGHGGIFSDRDVVAVAKKYPQLYLEISVEYEAGKLENTIATLGADRIMFGSDCPLHHPAVMRERVKVIKLSREDEEKIFWKTARKVFALNIPEGERK